MGSPAYFLEVFTSGYYLRQSPEAVGQPDGGADHYKTVGWRALLDPHPLFSTRWYLDQIGGALAVDPLSHYIDEGAARGLSPHPLFDPVLYCEGVGSSALTPTPLHNFLRRDVAAFVSPHWLFDVALYWSMNPDVHAAGANPLMHYLSHGEAEGRRPSIVFEPSFYQARVGTEPEFGGGLTHFAAQMPARRGLPSPLIDLDWYARQLDQGEARRTDLLRHLVEVGSHARLSPHPLFDSAFYLRDNPDIAAVGVGAFWHYVVHGARENRAPHPLFSSVFYQRQTGLSGGVTALSHYLAQGAQGRADPNPVFDSAYYRDLYGDSIAENVTPLEDYVRRDPEQRRHPHPLFDGLHQALATGAPEPGAQPLPDYFQGRANIDPAIVASSSSSVFRAYHPRAMQGPAGSRPASGEPLISVLIPMFESDSGLLRRCFDSIRSQTFTNWEVIAVDDGSVTRDCMTVALAYADRDQRFRAFRLERNSGISTATNNALARATGDFVAMVDHDDVLMPGALRALVDALADGDQDAAYTDQSYITVDGRFDGDHYKPDWSPALLEGVMYVGHLLTVRRTLALEVDGFDSRFDKVQDFEFMLRIGERTKRIAHARGLHYGWRRVPGSIALDSAEKGDIEPLQAAALDAHFRRLGRSSRAVAIPGLHHRMRIVPEPRAHRPAFDLIRIRATSRPGSSEAACESDGAFASTVMVPGDDVSGFAAAFDRGTAPYVLCWEEGVEAPQDWRDFMLQYLEQEDVAFCAPHLVGDGDTILMAGLATDPREGLVPAMTGLRAGQDGYAGSLACDREVSALSGGFLGVKRSVWVELGGVDRDYGGLFYALAELSFRAARGGRRNIALAGRTALRADGRPAVAEPLLSDRLIFTDRHETRLAGGDPYDSVMFSGSVQEAARPRAAVGTR